METLPAICLGDSLVISTNTDLKTLNPLNSLDDTSNQIMGLIFNGVIGIDKYDKLCGDLAETWEVSEDRKTVTFFLHEGIKWHDGHEFSARDVLFTFNLLKDPDTESAIKEFASPLQSIEIVSSLIFKAHFSEPYYESLAIFLTGILPEHLFCDEDINTSGLHMHPVGTGPFRFTEWSPNEQIVLEAFPDYFGGRPFLKRYIVKIMADSSMAFLALKRGDIDLLGLNPDQYTKQSDDQFKEQFNIFAYSRARSYAFLSYNCTAGTLNNVKVRTALTMAVNRDSIIRDVLHGFGKKISGPFPPDSWPYDKSIDPLPYNPDQARSLLAEEGISDSDGDGFLDHDGKIFSLRLFTVNGNESYMLSAKMIEHFWSALGVKVDFQPKEFSSLLDIIQQREYDTLILGYVYGFNFNLTDLWHSSMIPDNSTGVRGLNMMGFSDSRVDEIIDSLKSEFNESSRLRLYQELHAIVHREQPQLFLFTLEYLIAVDKRFHNLELSPTGIFHNLTTWFVPELLQKYR
ncbi:MAG: ABC transporter substrate-binding protein [Candidatus Wallbacteria bacterium]|nr:ABC transporter substrate-binding protein [Candidatus Wallbacteria bacterium]